MMIKFRKAKPETLVTIALVFGFLSIAYLYYQYSKSIVINGVAVSGNKTGIVIPFIMKAEIAHGVGGKIYLDI